MSREEEEKEGKRRGCRKERRRGWGRAKEGRRRGKRENGEGEGEERSDSTVQLMILLSKSTKILKEKDMAIVTSTR